MSLWDRIEGDFSYHAPTDMSVESMRVIREMAKDLAHTIDALVPNSREKSTALTKLEEVSMHANAGIARHQSEEPF